MKSIGSFYRSWSQRVVWITCVIVTTFFCCAKAQCQQSLWEKRDPHKAFLFHDLKARNVGDLITVIIRENTDVANADSRQLSKSSDTSANGSLNYGGSGGSGSVSAGLDATSDRSFDGDTTYSSEREFSDRFTATVIDVLPNGNLVIGGERKVMVEGDVKTLTLSGIVRGLDLRGDNTVFSQNVASLQLRFEGKGPESQFTNQGWLSRRVNKWWPF